MASKEIEITEDDIRFSGVSVGLAPSLVDFENYNVTIYGAQDAIDDITSLNVVLDLSGLSSGEHDVLPSYITNGRVTAMDGGISLRVELAEAAESSGSEEETQEET